VDCLIAFIVCAVVALGTLQQSQALTEAAVVALALGMFAIIGVGAGVAGANYRKKGDLKTAITAYRVAVWCLFFALLQALSIHGAIHRDEFKKQFDEDKKRFDEKWHFEERK
jgi:hypothetical protein